VSERNAAARRIRRAVPADAEFVRMLTRAAYAAWVPLIGREPLPMRADYERAVREHLIDLLDVGGTLAALIEIVPAPDHLLVLNVAVAPEFQGQGHGSYLMRHAEGVAAALGVPELRLFTNKQFGRNIELYRSLGYAIDREEPFMGGFTVYMSKRLGGASA